MRTFIIGIFIIGICITLMNGISNKGNTMTLKTDKTIVLQCSKEAFALGEQIDIEVLYENNSSNPVTFRDPAKTWEVMLEVFNLSDSSTQRLPFGKIITKTNKFGIQSEAQEPADDITIKPKEVYQFTAPIYAQHLNIFSPNMYRMKVIDRTNDSVTLTSNELELTVEATNNSFKLLIAICSDENQSIDNREFSVSWLREFYPDFEYTVENPTKKQQSFNNKMINDVTVWWETAKDSPDLAKTIIAINTQAGIVPKEEQ